jgi:hypothetical protein
MRRGAQGSGHRQFLHHPGEQRRPGTIPDHSIAVGARAKVVGSTKDRAAGIPDVP